MDLQELLKMDIILDQQLYGELVKRSNPKKEKDGSIEKTYIIIFLIKLKLKYKVYLLYINIYR